jgi:UDP-arabinose 4-epimerase
MSRGRVLVTGGAGYIGSHACKLLAAAGIEPIVYDNLIAGHSDSVRWGPFVEGDLLDTELLVRTLQDFRPDTVIHFAAFAYVGESVVNPAKYYRNNVVGSLSLLDACQRSQTRNIIFSSSCATYGAPAQMPITEATLQRPISPYGCSKLMVEQLMRDYASAYDLRYVALRYFNACGADPDGELAERHDPETHLIPRALLAAGGQLEHLAIFGDDHETIDGTCVRDYVHVTDLARAHVQAVDYLRSGGPNLAVNLGSGRPTSILEVVAAIERVTRRSVPVLIMPRRPGDPSTLFADSSLAGERLGFRTQLSDIDTIIRTAAPAFGHAAQPGPLRSTIPSSSSESATQRWRRYTQYHAPGDMIAGKGLA